MVEICMREFTHNIGKYMERVNNGEKFVITKRNRPVADIIPHNKEKVSPGWSLEMPKLKIKGLSMSKELIKQRQKERS